MLEKSHKKKEYITEKSQKHVTRICNKSRTRKSHERVMEKKSLTEESQKLKHLCTLIKVEKKLSKKHNWLVDRKKAENFYLFVVNDTLMEYFIMTYF